MPWHCTGSGWGSGSGSGSESGNGFGTGIGIGIGDQPGTPGVSSLTAATRRPRRRETGGSGAAAAATFADGAYDQFLRRHARGGLAARRSARLLSGPPGAGAAQAGFAALAGEWADVVAAPEVGRLEAQATGRGGDVRFGQGERGAVELEWGA